MLCSFFVGSHPAPSFKSSGRIAISVVVVPERGLPEEEVLIKRCQSIEEGEWEALILGLSVGRSYGFNRLPIQCSRKSILNTLTNRNSNNDLKIEPFIRRVLELSKHYESVDYYHCNRSSNPAATVTHRFFLDNTFQLSATLTGRQTICVRAANKGEAVAAARAETWPAFEQLVRFEGLYLDDIDIQDVKTLNHEEFEVGAMAFLRFQIPLMEECREAAEARGPGFEPQLLELAHHYGLENPAISRWRACS